ncbi:hypothetical protein BBJ28_00000697 [Nothophytophthora sp. Chile5]|nr:hypothetical protein BBJ28_00000697 [Nothophytophthora sp. Chile5]
MKSSAKLTAIRRAVDTPSKNVVQTVDGQKIVLVCDAHLAYGDVVVRPRRSFFCCTALVSRAHVLLGSLACAMQGEESLSGSLISAGPILDLIDHFAAALAEKYGWHGAVRGEKRGLTMLRHDAVSLLIRGSGYRYDLDRAQFIEVLSAFATLVAIDMETMRPRPGLPKLIHPTDPSYVQNLEAVAKQRKELAVRWRAVQEAVDQLPHVSMAMLKDFGQEYTSLVSVPETLLEVQTSFLPRHLNRNNTIFGGDVLAFMVCKRIHLYTRIVSRICERMTGCVCRFCSVQDKVALQCAKSFTKNKNMVTVAMNRISFKLPINMDDIVTMHARRISTGLQVSEADQASMRTLLKAQHRWNFDQEERKILALDPLALTTTASKTVRSPSLRGRL